MVNHGGYIVDFKFQNKNLTVHDIKHKLYNGPLNIWEHSIWRAKMCIPANFKMNSCLQKLLLQLTTMSNICHRSCHHQHHHHLYHHHHQQQQHLHHQQHHEHHHHQQHQHQHEDLHQGLPECVLMQVNRFCHWPFTCNHRSQPDHSNISK